MTATTKKTKGKGKKQSKSKKSLVGDDRVRDFSFTRAVGFTKCRNSEKLSTDLQVELYIGEGWEVLIGPESEANMRGPRDFILYDRPLSKLLYLSCLELGFTHDLLTLPKIRVCKICNVEFGFRLAKNHIVRHIASHFSGLGYVTKCPIDGNQTNRPDNHKRHLEKCPGGDFLDEDTHRGFYNANKRLL